MTERMRLHINDISKTFTRAGKPPVEALRGIELTIAEGEFVAIVGASGSGKSTLLRIIDGLLEPRRWQGARGWRRDPRPGPGPGDGVPARRVAAVEDSHRERRRRL